MQIFIYILLICVSLAEELNTYKEYLTFATKNHYKSVDNYSKVIGINDFDKQWTDFKVKFGREYSHESQEERKFYFLKSLQFIESHKELLEKGLVSHEVDINQFADWSPEEYESMMSFDSLPYNWTQKVEEYSIQTPVASLPASFDWRQQNKVTAIKNQGQCGSCWAFATTATIESAYLIKHNERVSLSEQQLVDCNTENSGCNWGNVGKAMAYVQQNGIETETAYRYVGRKQNCLNSGSSAHKKIAGYVMLSHPASDQQIMNTIMNYGPIAVNIDCNGNDFKLYRGGVITGGPQQMNHYVTAVGWGTDYWIIKNSWGTQWGEGGFGRIRRGANVRGFNQWLFYPHL